jgi:hypothetical protein
LQIKVTAEGSRHCGLRRAGDAWDRQVENQTGKSTAPERTGMPPVCGVNAKTALFPEGNKADRNDKTAQIFRKNALYSGVKRERKKHATNEACGRIFPSKEIFLAVALITKSFVSVSACCPTGRAYRIHPGHSMRSVG